MRPDYSLCFCKRQPFGANLCTKKIVPTRPTFVFVNRAGGDRHSRDILSPTCVFGPTVEFLSAGTVSCFLKRFHSWTACLRDVGEQFRVVSHTAIQSDKMMTV